MTDQTAEVRLTAWLNGERIYSNPDEMELDVAAVLADRERLRLAMKPFAEAAEYLHPSHPDDGVTLDGIEVRHWRAAWAALNTQGEG